MITTSSKVSRTAALVLALGVAASASAGSRQAVPHSGGGGGGHAPRAAAPSHGGHGGAYRAAPARGSVPARGSIPARGTATRAVAPRGTANGVARYGYYNGGGAYWGGYPCWGWGGWYPWWGGGWYGGWGWGWGGYGYGYGYGPAYGAYGDVYVASTDDGDAEDYEPPRSGPAVVETAVSPSKAQVLLDGEDVGFASDYSGRWDELSVAPGHHTITFRAKGYRTLVVELTALPGATYVLKDALVTGEGEDRRTIEPPAAPAREHAAAPPAMGRLRVHVDPADAAVYLDGQYLGVAGELARMHGALSIPTGSHILDVTRPGYETVSRPIDVGGAEVTTFALTLTATP